MGYRTRGFREQVRFRGGGGGIGLRFVFVVAGPVNFKSLGCISTDLKLSISTCQFEAHAVNP